MTRAVWTYGLTLLIKALGMGLECRDGELKLTRYASESWPKRQEAWVLIPVLSYSTIICFVISPFQGRRGLMFFEAS